MTCWKNCFGDGVCRRCKVELVTNAELSDPNFLIDVKQTASTLFVEKDGWLETVFNLYRDFDGVIIDQSGKEILLDMDVFEQPSIRFWFRDFCKPIASGSVPRIRAEAFERVRVFATLLKATFPNKAMMWGIRAANDNQLRHEK